MHRGDALVGLKRLGNARFPVYMQHIFHLVFSKFSYSCNFAFSVLLRTFLDSLRTFDFPVSVRISNFLFIVGLFECFCGCGHPIRFYEGFWFTFPRLSLVGCKTSRGDIFYLSRVSFPSSLNGPRATLFFFSFL